MYEEALKQVQAILQSQTERVEKLKNAVPPKDFSTLSHIIIGVIGGDGIGPIITEQAERVLRLLLKDELNSGRVEIREISGLTLENRIAHNATLPDDVLAEIKAVKEACGGKLLKVIVEACLLTESEKIAACGIVSEAGADFIKTSTGFSTGGATFEDVKLFREHVGPSVRIKAAGGIATLEDARKFIELGASRLGTSRIVKLVKETERSSDR